MSRRLSILQMVIAFALVLMPLAGCAPGTTQTPMAEPTEVPPTAEPTEVPPTAEPTEVPPTPTPVPATPEPSGPQGTLTVAHGEKLEALDPQARLQIHSYNVALMIYDSLVDLSEAGEPLPRLATDWQLLDENTWEFTLREGVEFHNGEPFTCESVKFTLDRIVDPETNSAQSGVWANYTETECPTPYTAIVRTSAPMGTMLTNLALTAMLPPEAGETMDFSTEAIGTGPFEFVEWVLDDHLTLQANTEYWGDVPKVQTVIERWIPEETTRVSALEVGEVDLVWGVPPEEKARLDEAPNVVTVEHPTYFNRFLWMNGGREPFDDPNVRDAMRYAIDIDTIIETIFVGEAVRADSCVAEGVFGYCPQELYPYDPDRAKALLEEAGYPDGFETEMKVATFLPKHMELAEAIAAYLSTIGIDAEITLQDQALWIDDLLALNWDLNLLGTGTITGDADFTLRRIYQTSAERTGYYNDELNELLVEQQSVLDLDERLDMICDACEILWDDGPTVWLFTQQLLYAHRDRVEGFVPRLNEFFYYDEISLAE
jgi:peptide/nickel transport system substrate-binding protein